MGCAPGLPQFQCRPGVPASLHRAMIITDDLAIAQSGVRPDYSR